MLGSVWNEQATNILFYEDIPFSILELQENRILKATWFNLAAQEVATYPVLVPITGLVSDVLEQLKQLAYRGQLKLETKLGRMRVVVLHNHCITGHIKPTEVIQWFVADSHNHFVRCEEIPDDEIDMPEDSIVVSVVHYAKSSQTYPVRFGNPFSLALGKMETAAEVRQRIRSRLNERAPG
jgi:hypothetical protein